MKHLITGATGVVGSLVTERLVARGARPRVFVRDRDKARAMFGDQVEVSVGDLSRARRSLPAALDGIDVLFLLNSGPLLAGRDRAAALAAKAAGVKHVVKLSTLDVLTGVGTGPWHARGEAAIRESGVSLTSIRSSAFMTNALSWAHAIKAEGVLRTSTGNGKIAFIHPADIADVAVELLTRPARDEAVVITGPEALSYPEMAATIGAAIGRKVRFRQLSDADARKNALRFSGGRRYAEALVDIWRSVRLGRLDTRTDGVRRCLGRDPVSFDRWVAQNVSAFS
jgi:uncharacterized protein YbjT (DUF2867 family)